MLRRTAGCGPATSCAPTPTAPTPTSGARRRSSAAAARTSRRPRSRRRSTSHPDVAEAAVVGVPSELSEEEVKAFVVLLDGDGRPRGHPRARGASGSPRSRCRATSRSVAELPHTPTGRVAKHKLPRERTPGEMDFDAHERRLAAHERRHLPTPDSITVDGPRRGRRADGQRDAHRAGVPARAAAAAEPAGDAAARRRARLARRPRADADACWPRGSPTRARPSRSRARSRPGCSARARCSSASSRTPRASSAAILADEPTDLAARGARGGARGRRRVPGLGHPVHKVAGPAHARASTRSRRRRACSGRTCGCCATSPRPTAPRRARAADQRRRRRRAPRSPTSASAPSCCAASRCSRAPPGCSATSPRRWSARSGCRSTARWTSARPTSRRPGVGDRRQRLDGARVVLLVDADVRLLAHRARRDADRLHRRRGVEHGHEQQRLDRHRPRPARVVARLRRPVDLGGGEHAPPHRGVEDQAVAGLDPRAPREAGAAQQRGTAVEPILGERAARMADRLQPVARHGT